MANALTHFTPAIVRAAELLEAFHATNTDMPLIYAGENVGEKLRMVSELHESTYKAFCVFLDAWVKAGTDQHNLHQVIACLNERAAYRVEKIRARKALEKNREIAAFFEAAADAIATIVPDDALATKH